MVCVAWVFFRAESVGEAVEYLGRMIFTDWQIELVSKKAIVAIATCIIMDWFHRHDQGLFLHFQKNKLWRWSAYAIIVHFLIQKSAEPASFIYFQF